MQYKRHVMNQTRIDESGRLLPHIYQFQSVTNKRLVYHRPLPVHRGSNKLFDILQLIRNGFRYHRNRHNRIPYMYGFRARRSIASTIDHMGQRQRVDDKHLFKV